MYEEYKAKGYKGVFFTLTYDENSVPKNYLVDFRLFRSSPDYRFDNSKDRKKGERRKFFEAPDECVKDYRDRTFINFNVRRSKSEHDDFVGQVQEKFVNQCVLTERPMVSLHESDWSEPSLDIEELNFDLTKYYNVDETTGEVLFREPKLKPYCFPFSFCFQPTPVVFFNSVRKEDVQLWLKRNRTRSVRENPEFDFTYFITSEYGPRTLRPHYHGVFFGVSAQDVSDWFKDWQRHYGVIVKFEDLDPSKGGLSYVSKYCSKGSFEHPLCCKDFFYFRHRADNLKDVLCSEYHSKHYEKCMEWFGLDEPIVDPTFHLVSKGLGVDWCDKDLIRAKEFDELVYEPTQPLFEIDDLLSGTVPVDVFIEKFDNYEKQNQKYFDWLSAFADRCKYRRTFRIKGEEQTFAYSLPQYWRSKMFSDNLRNTYSHFIRSHFEELYRQQLGYLDSDKLDSTDSEKVLALEYQSQQEIVDRFNFSYERYKKFCNKSQL